MFKKTVLTRTLFFMTADILLITFSVWLSFLLRFDGIVPDEFLTALEMSLIFAVVFTVPIFYFFGLYSFSWSYVSTRELISLIAASSFSFLFSGLAVFLSRDYALFRGFPRSTLFIGYILILFFTAGIRFSKRVYLQFFKKEIGSSEKERVLIVGAGDAGEQILRNMQTAGHYQPVGLIDDNPVKKGSYIHGIKVFGGVNDIPTIVSKYKIESIIVAFPSVRIEVVKKAVEKARRSGVSKIKILPPLSEIVDGKISLSDIRDFKLEDLLQRYPIVPELVNSINFLKGKVVLVVGAAGSIGSELCRQIIESEPSMLLLLDQDETGIFNIQKELKEKFLKTFSIIADIQDEVKIRKVFEEFKPNIVFHAAAYKHVPLMEQEPEEAVKNNIFGTKILAQAAIDFRAEKFIFISTDKAVNPVSVMGATKRIGEMICQVFNRKDSAMFVSVRFGNVLGSRGSVIPIFKEQIKKGGPVVVTHEDMKRYFMIISEAVNLVLQASGMNNGGQVLVLDMGNPVRIMDLAREVIRFSGLEPDKDIPIVISEPRPGEKLFEEILTSEEKGGVSSNKSIFFAKLSGVDEVWLNNILDRLFSAAKNSDRKTIFNILKEIK